MNNEVETTNTVSPKIADTLSSTEEQNLRQAFQEHDVRHNIKDYHDESLDSKAFKIAKRLQQLTIIRGIKSHPLQSVGLALLGGFLVRSVFSRK